MVSVQEPISPNQRKTSPKIENSTKKRKWDESGKETFKKKSNVSNSLFDIEFNVERHPLPLEWKQCLDIQSGQIYFYNTTTKKRTFKDPRQSLEREKMNLSPMSLDLELNLPCDSLGTHAKCDLDSLSLNLNTISNNSHQQKKNYNTLTRCTSWMSFEEDHKEMVAVVCMQCHMLVMLCKSSPRCPNCKFIYPPGPSNPNLFKV